MRSLAYAITGWRPTQFRFKYDESHAACKKIKDRLSEQITFLYGQGMRTFYIKSTLGVDMWAGEIMIRLSKQHELAELGIALILPFPGHDKNWDAYSRKRMEHLHRQSKSITELGSSTWPIAKCYRECDKYIVAQSDGLLAVCTPGQLMQSSPAAMVKLAQKEKKPITYILPDTGEVIYPKNELQVKY